jgi:hypothetical protein
MAHRIPRRLAAQAACVTTLAGAGLATIGATAALAGTATSAYTCSLSGIIPLTQAGALTLTAPDTGTSGSMVDVDIAAPQGTTTSPVAITSLTISGTATVSGDGPVTALAFSGTNGPSAAGAAPPAVPTTETLTLPRHGGPVTVTLPMSYTLSINLGFGIESGTCTTTSPGSVSIVVTCHHQRKNPAAGRPARQNLSIPSDDSLDKPRPASRIPPDKPGFIRRDVSGTRKTRPIATLRISYR